MRRISTASIPHTGATASGANGCASSPIRSAPTACSASGPGSGEPLGEQRVGDREQQQRVGTGADEVVLGGLAGGAAAAWIDDDHLAAALADRTDAAAHVGRRQQRPVGDERVGAEDHQVVGTVDVGDRHAEPGAEHQSGGNLLRHLIDRRRRVDVLRAERLQERRPVEGRPEAVGGRVADVDGDRRRGRPRRAPARARRRSPRMPPPSSPRPARRRGGSAAA